MLFRKGQGAEEIEKERGRECVRVCAGFKGQIHIEHKPMSNVLHFPLFIYETHLWLWCVRVCVCLYAVWIR